MIRATITFPKGLAETLKAEIRSEMEAKVYPVLRRRANEALDDRVENPNSPQYKAAYTLTVDGRAAGDRSAINDATYWVRITFVQSAIRLAVRIMSQILRDSIMQGASPAPWINKEKMAVPIRMFYGGVGMPVREITHENEIEAFIPGDFICLTPSFSTQVFSNAKKYGAAGYMAKAARRIRTKLKATKRDSPISVAAGRSRAVFERMGPGYRKDGSVVHPTRPEWGAWAIYIRYRMNTQLGE